MTAPGPSTGTNYSLLMPWMPDELITIYTDAYVEYGDPELAWAAVRQASQYEQYFPGNRREDGSLRLSEQAYTSVIEGYSDVFISIGLNPRIFEFQFVALIEGDVSPDELMRDRVMPIYERVIESIPEVMEYYATQFNLEMTPAAIMAAALDPDTIGVSILSRQIALSEIGGEAAQSGFDIDLDFAERFIDADFDQSDADEFFGRAQSLLPVLETLSKRHADSDDDFDINEFANAELFQDPKQRRRIRRLMAQESSTFTGGAQVDFVRNRQGAMSGLTET